jgi:hypothetical protein
VPLGFAAVLLDLAEKARAGLCHFAVRLRAGEFCPSGLFYYLISPPRLGFFEFIQVYAGVGRVLEFINADRRQYSHDSRLFGILDLFVRGAAKSPSAPLEADDHGSHGASGGALQEARERLTLQN